MVGTVDGALRKVVMKHYLAGADFRIPVLAYAELVESLLEQKECTQIHLVGPDDVDSDFSLWTRLERWCGTRFDRSLLFRLGETQDLNLLVHSGRLQALSLIGCNLGKSDWSFLSTHRESLVLLCLGDNVIGAAGARELAEKLGRLSRLETLVLECNDIRSTGAKELAEPLGGLSQLTTLILGGDDLDAAGAKELAGSLGRLTRLERLELNGNKIDSAGAKELAETLGRLSQLTTLELAFNNIGPAGANALAEAMARLTQLKTLLLMKNAIGDEGLLVLAQAYERGAMQSLRHVDLECNDIHCVDEALLATRDAERIFNAVLEGVALPHARVMLLGMGGVGKSLSARRTFLDCVQEEGPHDPTHDILVLRPEECEWMPWIEETQVRTWVWDFAGQLVTHGVHESFLQDEGRTIYVVVLAADREPDRASATYDGNRLRYRLQMLRYTVGSVAPVLIVVTQNDKWNAKRGPKPVDLFLDWPEVTPPRALKDVELDEFANRLNVSVINVVTDFSACDATYPIREGLQRVIQDAVSQLGVVKDKRVPRKFVPLKNMVEDRLPNRTLLGRAEFDEWCAEVEIEGGTLRDELLRMLHHMGSLIYWGRSESEADQPRRHNHYHREDQLLARAHRAPPGSLQTYILNPLWFKTCVYAITRASEELNDGIPRVRLTATDLDQIVGLVSAGLVPFSVTHPVEGSVIREMLRFIGVCWEDEASGEFLFPRGLPERDWTEYQAWDGHRLTWNFLPEHCVAKLLVRLHENGLVVSRKRGSYVHDRNTALIKYPPESGNQTLVSAVPDHGQIEIRYSPATQPDQRQSTLQHLLVILQARELQGRPPVISAFRTKETESQRPPIRITGLSPADEAELDRSAMNPVVPPPADHAPPVAGAKEWKGKLLVNPAPMVVVPYDVVSRFYQIGLCYEKMRSDIAERGCREVQG